MTNFFEFIASQKAQAWVEENRDLPPCELFLKLSAKDGVRVKRTWNEWFRVKKMALEGSKKLEMHSTVRKGCFTTIIFMY